MHNIFNRVNEVTSDPENIEVLDASLFEYNLKDQNSSLSNNDHKIASHNYNDEVIGALNSEKRSPMMFSLSFYSILSRTIYFCVFLDSISLKNLVKLISKNKITRLYVKNDLFFFIQRLRLDSINLKLVFTDNLKNFNDIYTEFNDFKYKSDIENLTKLCITELVINLRNDLQINVTIDTKINQIFLDDKLYMMHKVPYVLNLIDKTRRKESLLNKINYTKTNLGEDLLKMNLLQPLYCQNDLKERRKIVEHFKRNSDLFKSLCKTLKRLSCVKDVMFLPHINKSPSLENYKICVKKTMRLSIFFECCNVIKNLINNDLPIFKKFKSAYETLCISKLIGELLDNFNQKCSLSKKRLFQRDEIVKFVKSGRNDYLDLARKIYFEEQEDLLNAFNELHGIFNFKIVHHESEGMIYKVSNIDIVKNNLFNFSQEDFTLENYQEPRTQLKLTKGDISDKIKGSKILYKKNEFDLTSTKFFSDTENSNPCNSTLVSDDRTNVKKGSNFILISTDKGFSLVTTKKIQNLNNKLNEIYNQIVEIEGNYCLLFLQNNHENIIKLLDLSELIAEMDVCISILKYSSLYKCSFPVFDSFTHIKKSYHPMLNDQNIFKNDYYSCPYLRFNILTGPNMSGKTTYIKQLAYLIILNQIGYPITAEDGTMRLYNKLFIRLNISNLNHSDEGMELNDFNDMMKYSDNNTMILIDEIGKNFDSYFMIRYLIAVSKILSERNSFVYFITHQYEIIDHLKEFENINVLKNIDHKVKSGVSRIFHGIKTCKEILSFSVMKEIVYFYDKVNSNNKKLQFKNSKVRLALRIKNCKSEEEKKEIIKYLKKRVQKQ